MNNSVLNLHFDKNDFSAADLDLILSRYQEVDYKKGELLLVEGKVANHYWFVESGFLRSYAVDPEGNDITTGFYSKGDIVIDWISFFQRKPTRENIQVIKACSCHKLDFDSFQNLFHGIEAFREGGRSRLVRSYFELKNKGISHITDSAKTRYLRLIDEKPEVLLNASLKHIATYLGITETSLSRVRNEVAKGEKA